MNQEDLFKKIGLIVKELSNQYEYLAQNPHQLNELELALFHANADFLSDHAKILIKINKSEPTLEIQSAVNEEPEIEVIQGEDRKEELESEYYGDSLQEQQQVEAITFAEEVPETEEEIFKLDQTPSSFEFILSESSKSDSIESISQTNHNSFTLDNFIANDNTLDNDEKFEFEEKSVDELFNRPLSQEEENILAQKRKLSEARVETSIEVDEDEIGPEPFLVSKPIEEDFPIEEVDLALEEAIEPIINTEKAAVEDPNYKPTLNDLLAGKTDRSVNENNIANRVSDLKQAINLNDKLLYIKDLFNGYNLAYAEAIDLANKLPNFEAADNFFKKNYAVKNNWADKQATVDKFYGLLNQRFK